MIPYIVNDTVIVMQFVQRHSGYYNSNLYIMSGSFAIRALHSSYK